MGAQLFFLLSFLMKHEPEFWLCFFSFGTQFGRNLFIFFTAQHFSWCLCFFFGCFYSYCCWLLLIDSQYIYIDMIVVCFCYYLFFSRLPVRVKIADSKRFYPHIPMDLILNREKKTYSPDNKRQKKILGIFFRIRIHIMFENSIRLIFQYW